MAAGEGSPQPAPPRWIADGTRRPGPLRARARSSRSSRHLSPAAGSSPLFWLAAGIAMLVEWTAMTRVEPRRPLRRCSPALGVSAARPLCLQPSSSCRRSLAALGRRSSLALVAGAGPATGSGRRAGFLYAAVIVARPAGRPGAIPSSGSSGCSGCSRSCGRRISRPISRAGGSAARSFGRGSARRRPGRASAAASLAGDARPGFWSRGVSPSGSAGRRFELAGRAVLSAAASVASQLGDLGESALKRTLRRQGFKPPDPRAWGRHGPARRLLGGCAPRAACPRAAELAGGISDDPLRDDPGRDRIGRPVDRRGRPRPSRRLPRRGGRRRSRRDGACRASRGGSARALRRWPTSAGRADAQGGAVRQRHRVRGRASRPFSRRRARRRRRGRGDQRHGGPAADPCRPEARADAIALANKESLVCAGAAFMADAAAARRRDRAGRFRAQRPRPGAGGRPTSSDVDVAIITATGGPVPHLGAGADRRGDPGRRRPPIRSGRWGPRSTSTPPR